MDYKGKYIKYKIKYLTIKNIIQIGGDLDHNILEAIDRYLRAKLHPSRNTEEEWISNYKNIMRIFHPDHSAIFDRTILIEELEISRDTVENLDENQIQEILLYTTQMANHIRDRNLSRADIRADRRRERHERSERSERSRSGRPRQRRPRTLEDLIAEAIERARAENVEGDPLPEDYISMRFRRFLAYYSIINVREYEDKLKTLEGRQELKQMYNEFRTAVETDPHYMQG